TTTSFMKEEARNYNKSLNEFISSDKWYMDINFVPDISTALPDLSWTLDLNGQKGEQNSSPIGPEQLGLVKENLSINDIQLPIEFYGRDIDHNYMGSIGVFYDSRPDSELNYASDNYIAQDIEEEIVNTILSFGESQSFKYNQQKSLELWLKSRTTNNQFDTLIVIDVLPLEVYSVNEDSILEKFLEAGNMILAVGNNFKTKISADTTELITSMDNLNKLFDCSVCSITDGINSVTGIDGVKFNEPPLEGPAINFISSSSSFLKDNVSPGDILEIYNGSNPRKYTVDLVVDENSLILSPTPVIWEYNLSFSIGNKYNLNFAQPSSNQYLPSLNTSGSNSAYGFLSIHSLFPELIKFVENSSNESNLIVYEVEAGKSLFGFVDDIDSDSFSNTSKIVSDLLRFIYNEYDFSSTLSFDSGNDQTGDEQIYFGNIGQLPVIALSFESFNVNASIISEDYSLFNNDVTSFVADPNISDPLDNGYFGSGLIISDINNVTIADSDSLDVKQFTLEFDIRPTIPDEFSYRNWIEKDNTFRIHQYGNDIQAQVYVNNSWSTQIIWNNILQDNQWDHVRFIYDGQFIHLIVNGEIIPKIQVMASPMNLTPSSSNLRIGGIVIGATPV
ncbi:hypothetical protein LCGC14_2216610, partial [marine sediment metagenome]